MILILRPEPGAGESARRCAALGLPCRIVPLFATEAVDWAAPAAAGFDALLLTSANAVRHAARHPGGELAALSALPCWCVGAATADAARQAGLAVARTGNAGVQSLIDHAPPARLLWLAGEDHSALAMPPGGAVTVVPVYRAAPLPVAPAALAGGEVALLHSPRAAARLAEIAPDRGALALVAISAATARAAGPGWRAVRVAPRPDDSEMVAIAAELCHKRPDHSTPDPLRDQQG
jgi:uroporphyrinogen-III synthase